MSYRLTGVFYFGRKQNIFINLYASRCYGGFCTYPGNAGDRAKTKRLKLLTGLMIAHTHAQDQPRHRAPESRHH